MKLDLFDRKQHRQHLLQQSYDTLNVSRFAFPHFSYFCCCFFFFIGAFRVSPFVCSSATFSFLSVCLCVSIAEVAVAFHHMVSKYRAFDVYYSLCIYYRCISVRCMRCETRRILRPFKWEIGADYKKQILCI